MPDCIICGNPSVRKGRKTCSVECGRLSKIKPRPACLYCGQLCRNTDQKYCSSVCAGKAKKGSKQSQETIRKRIENTDQNRKEETRKQTMLERYGEDNPAKIEEFMEKIVKKSRGSKRPRVEGQQEAIIEAKRKNGTLKHSEETKKKLGESLRKTFADPEFDRSVFVNKGSNGKNSKTGYYNGVYFRSSYEEMFIRFCENYNIKLESAANKNHCIKYLASDNKVRSYYPDFYLPESNTTVEIKPISMYEFGENQNKFMAALDSVENYVILSELDGFICESEWEEFYETDVKYWLQT